MSEVAMPMSALVLDADGNTVLPNCRYRLIEKHEDLRYLTVVGYTDDQNKATEFTGQWIRDNPSILTKYTAFWTNAPAKPYEEPASVEYYLRTPVVTSIKYRKSKV